MARPRRRTFGSSFTAQTARVVGSAVLGKVVLWGAAILVLKRLGAKSTAGQTALRVAAPPTFIVNRLA